MPAHANPYQFMRIHAIPCQFMQFHHAQVFVHVHAKSCIFSRCRLFDGVLKKGPKVKLRVIELQYLNRMTSLSRALVSYLNLVNCNLSCHVWMILFNCSKQLDLTISFCMCRASRLIAKLSPQLVAASQNLPCSCLGFLDVWPPCVHSVRLFILSVNQICFTSTGFHDCLLYTSDAADE